MNMIVPHFRESAVPLLDDLDAWIGPDHPARIIAMFVDTLHLSALGFKHLDAAAPQAETQHPAAMLKLFIFGYLNRIPSSRRLARETASNVECVWLTGNHMQGRAQIAGFRRANHMAIARACAQFMLLWKAIQQDGAYVAQAGSLQRKEARVARYITRLNRTDDHEDSAAEALRLDSPANRERRFQLDLARFAAGRTGDAACPVPLQGW